jgi:hypothetical protein
MHWEERRSKTINGWAGGWQHAPPPPPHQLTWKDTALNLPRHMNCEMLTSTASRHEAVITSAAAWGGWGGGNKV